MHLLINGLSARLGGGQTYLHQLLCHLPADWQVTLLTSGGFEVRAQSPQVTHVMMPKLANPFRRAWWEHTTLETLAQERGCDMIFNPACLLPRLRSRHIKTAVTFQNMLPFDRVQRRRYPLFSYRRLRDFLLERALVSAMRRADLVIYISTHAKDFIEQKCGVMAKHKALIPHALDTTFFRDPTGEPAALPTHLPLQKGTYFLYVSFIDFYKCQRETLRAYAALRAQHGITNKLVLVGAGYDRYIALVKQDIVALGLQEEVLMLGNLPHASLAALYQNAYINVFASTCENCPNILIEMMASGVPSLVSNHGPMPEIAGDTVTYFDPKDHTEFVSMWLKMLQSPDVPKANATRAIERAKRHCWKDAAQQTWRAMEALVGKS